MKKLSIEEAAVILNTTQDRARSRLAALGYTKVCERCGGCGRFSHNAVDGDRCYGCEGSGKKLVTLTPALVAEAAARIEAGELKAYFERAAAARSLKGLVKAFNTLVSASFVSTTYDANYRASGKVAAKAGKFIWLGDGSDSRARTLQLVACDEVRDIGLNDRFPGKQGRPDPLVTAARIAELTAFVVFLDEAYKAYRAELEESAAA